MSRVVLLAPLVWIGICPSASAQHEATYFGGRDLEPTAEERSVLEALDNNRPRGGPSGKPVVGRDKSVRFVFGASLPVIVCAPLQVCDVELQPGETVRSVQLGDTARWSVEPAITGAPPREIQHLIIKPTDVALRTSLVVTTDRRTYRMKLTSDRSRYMASVTFSYPSDGARKWQALSRKGRRAAADESGAEPRRRQRPSAPRAGSLGALSFDYELEGDDPPWKPVRVYNDGLQTVIEMPFAMRQTEAPTLLVVRAEGGLFTDDDVVQVNFHTEGTKYLVDMVFDVADLIVGVGSTQQKVRIRRK